MSSLICTEDSGFVGILSHPDKTRDEPALLLPSPGLFPERSDPESPTSVQLPENPREDKAATGSAPHTHEKRKRGQPKINHSDLGSSRRKRHSEVERKYREGLATGIDRLRTHVPTLPQHDGRFLAPLRLSKATVLAAAVEYIKCLEDRIRRLETENEGRKHKDAMEYAP